MALRAQRAIGMPTSYLTEYVEESRPIERGYNKSILRWLRKYYYEGLTGSQGMLVCYRQSER